MPATPRSRASGRGGDGSPRSQQVLVPMSERQQMALVMQLSSQEAPPASSNPGEERKKTRQQRNERGETPIHVAAIKGDHETVHNLLVQGQDPDVADFAGWTALHEACSYGWFQVVVVLVNGGANVNAKGLDDDTPLHDATTSGDLKMVKFLVEHGANPFVKNTKGKMPSDYAAPHIYDYIQSLKGECSIEQGSSRGHAREKKSKKKSKSKTKSRSESKHHKSDSKHHKSESKSKSKSKKRDKKDKDNSAKSSSKGSRDDSSKKGGGHASGHSENHKRNNMESLAQAEHYEGKEASSEKGNPSDNRDVNIPEGSQLSSGVVSSTQDEIGTCTKRSYVDDSHEAEPAEDEVSKKKKRKDNEDKELMAKPAPVSRTSTGRIITGSKPPGPASKTGATPLGKSGSSQSGGKGSSSSGKGSGQSQGKGSGGSKSSQSGHSKSGGSKGSGQSGKQDRKSPVASPKLSHGKDTGDGDEDQKSHEASPKVPPLKIVIPGGAGGSSGRNEQEGEGGTQRGGGKGRGSSATLPYVLPCTSTDTGQTSDSSDGIDDKRLLDGLKPGQRVLRSHRANDDKDKERTSPLRSGHHTSSTSKSPQNDHDHATSTTGKSESGKRASYDLHPRKRKLKSSKDSHSRESKHNDQVPDSTTPHNITHANPYQLYIHIRKQVDRRQRALFPVKPKPPKDFNKYLMNRCTYTLQRNVHSEPQVEIPKNLPPQMLNDFLEQEKERTRLRIQQLVEKEKLVLAVEQEILRVHGRAERAVANQALPFSVCTILRDREVYNILAPEQEEKRNAQRSRCNGRQINSWLQEVDDKWEKIKEGMLRRQHTEAQTLHAVQIMGWEWKLKELGVCDAKTSPKIDPTHVPQIHVANFDLPA